MLKDKNAFITGGDKGIGRAIVLKFAENGANTFFTYNTDLDSAKETKKQALKYGVEVEYFQLDVTLEQNVKSLIKDVIKRIKRIDILVNNAGIVYDGLFLMANMGKWWKVVDVIYGGTINVTKEVLYYMVSQKSGRIINMASVGGMIGVSGQTNYTSAKGAVMAYTKSLAKEVAKIGITVNSLAPGYVDTDMVRQYSEEIKKRFRDVVPMKRFASPEEVANAALFLASDLSSYITGQTIIVDGGMVS